MGDDVRARLGEDEWEALVSAWKAGYEADRTAMHGLREAVEGLAAEWECEPNPSDYHRKMCPACWRAGRLRNLLAAHPAPGELSADLRDQVAAAAEQQLGRDTIEEDA